MTNCNPTLFEIRNAQNKMDARIEAAVSAAIKEFESATGLSPNSIIVSLARVQELGTASCGHIVQYVISDVRLRP